MDKPRILIARAIFAQTVERLARHFELDLNERDEVFSSSELARRLRDKVGALVTPSERIDAQLLQTCPGLKIVANMAVGYNNFDLDAMTARGVQATNTPDVLTETTADFAFALILAAARRLGEAERYLRRGEWSKWSYDLFAGADVHGTTLGILGMGRIGQAIARRAAAGFGMKVIYHNRTRLPAETEAKFGASYVTKSELLRASDHLVLVLPYSAQSHHSIGAAELALMKPSATLVNIARGGVVDDAALAQALSEKRIAAAGLDVFEGEPRLDPALLALPNVVLTPHIASASRPTRLAMAELAADNLIEFFAGRGAPCPVNRIAAAAPP